MDRLQRFFTHVVVADCWEWVGFLSPDGYGRFGNSRRVGESQVAHRWLWEILIGPVPTGLDLDHLCRNRRCVNPDHLEPVTRAENLRRSPHPPRVKATECRNGHLWTPETTYLYRGQRYCLTCRRNYMAVYNAAHRRR